MKYKHIIWDWNGTLLDDRLFCIEIMNQVLQKRGMKAMSESWFLDNFCFPVKDYYIKLGFDFNKESFEISGSEFINGYMNRVDEISLHSDAVFVLNKAKNLGLTQSILSASSQAMLDDSLKYHEINSFFIKILGQDNHYAYGKEQSGKEWVQQLNFNSNKIILIGDTLHDKEVADIIGADCALVGTGHVSSKRLKETGAPVFNNLMETFDWISN
jgi:phosphoglycolate phosphatase